MRDEVLDIPDDDVEVMFLAARTKDVFPYPMTHAGMQRTASM